MISRRTLLLATVASATLLNPLNSSMISVALPSLGDELRLSFAGVTWLVSIFYLTSAVAQPAVGRLGDLYGKRRVFFSGLALVAASSLLALLPQFLLARPVPGGADDRELNLAALALVLFAVPILPLALLTGNRRPAEDRGVR